MPEMPPRLLRRLLGALEGAPQESMLVPPLEAPPPAVECGVGGRAGEEDGWHRGLVAEGELLQAQCILCLEKQWEGVTEAKMQADIDELLIQPANEVEDKSGSMTGLSRSSTMCFTRLQ